MLALHATPVHIPGTPIVPNTVKCESWAQSQEQALRITEYGPSVTPMRKDVWTLFSKPYPP